MDASVPVGFAGRINAGQVLKVIMLTETAASQLYAFLPSEITLYA